MLRFDRFKFRFIYYYFIFIHLFRYYPLFRLVFVQIRDEIIQAADQLVSVQFILIHYFNVLQCYNAMLCCQIVYLTNFGANYSRIRCSQELTDYKRAIEMEEDNSSRANLGIIIIISPEVPQIPRSRSCCSKEPQKAMALKRYHYYYY